MESHQETLADARPQTPEGLSDRAQDAWEPLLAIADLASGDWPDRARRAAVALSGNRDVDEEEIGVRLLAALRSAFEESATNKITSQCFLDHLHAQADEPWADWSRGNPISATKVAVLLRPFELKSKKIRIGDQTPRGYEWLDCEDAFLRYLPRDGGSRWNRWNNGSNKPKTAPSRSGTEAACSTLQNGQKPHEQADVPGVPLLGVNTGENGNPSVPQSQEDSDGSSLVWDFTERLERVGIEHEDAT